MSQPISVPDWEDLIDALPLTVTELDADFRVIRQFNAEDTPLDTPPENPFLPEWTAYLIQALTGDEPVWFETQASDAEATTYRHQVGRLADHQHLIVSSMDITAQKRAEEASRNEAFFLRRLLNSIDAGVSVFNFDTMQTVYVNEYKERLHGKPLSETPNYHYLDEIHPDDLPDAMNYGLNVIRNLPDDEVATNEYRIIDGRGKTCWVVVHDMVLSRGSDGRVVESIGVMVDITERKAMEAELARVKRWFDAIMNNSSDAIAISTVGDSYDDSQFITGNQRLEELTGYTLVELRGMRASQLLADELLPTVDERYRIHQSTDYLGIAEGLGKRKDGTIYPFERLGIKLASTGEQINFVRDITERKQREQALEDARLQAETALKARDVFIANMSHELRNPLHTIQGHIQLLLDQANLSQQVVEALHLIDYSADYLNRLIGDILDLSRVEAGFDSLHPTTFNPHYLVQRLRGMLSVQARRKSLDFRFDIADTVPKQIRMDEVKLKQILINLVDNAIKYTNHGGVVVRLDDAGEGRLRCVVTDTGAGMSQENTERLFKPFERGEAAEMAAGVGLGLAITQRLVGLMAGEIAVAAAGEAGTTVTVDLPFEADQPWPQPGWDSMPDLDGEDYEVLVVDDQHSDRQMLEAFLTRRGFSVKTAASGVEALRVVSDDVPDLIFMDLRLPGMDGVQTVKRIRDDCPDVPIIAITADMTPQGEKRLRAAGCNDVIFKPYRLEKIRETLVKFLVQAPTLRPTTVQAVIPLPTVAQLAALPEDWREAMYEICVGGGHGEAENHLQLIEGQHPDVVNQLRVALKRFLTTQIADVIALTLE